MEDCTTKCTLCSSAGLYQLNPENSYKVCNNHLNHCDIQTSILCFHCKELILIKNKANNCCGHLNSTNEALQDLEILNANDSSSFPICKTSCRNCENSKCPKNDILCSNSSESEIKSHQSVIVKSKPNYDECHNKNCSYYHEEDEKIKKCSEIENKTPQISNNISLPVKKTKNNSLYPSAKCVNCYDHKNTTSCGCKKIYESCREDKHNDECLNRNLNCKDVENVGLKSVHKVEPNKKCGSCGSLCSELTNRDCEHLRCLDCINRVCKACNLRKAFSNQCNYCKEYFQEVQLLDCSHKVCQRCFELNTYVLPSCKHIQCMNCCHEKNPCPKHSSFVQKFNFCNIYSKPDDLYESYNKDEAKECCSCSKILNFPMKNSCNHDICEKCFEEKKSCKICHPCLNCNANDAKKQDCGHYLCSNCLLHDSCSGCVKNNLLKTCASCKKTAECTRRDCQHFNCQKCNEQNVKCFSCLNGDFKFCTNCGEKIDNETKIRCGHGACWACSKNNECFSCMIKSKSLRNQKQNKYLSCSRCKKNVKDYIYLRCGHVLCMDCFKVAKTMLKIFNFSCLDCIKNTEKNYRQICSVCKKESQWFCEEEYPNLIRKICCKKIVCIKCKDTVCGSHSCRPCFIF